MLTSEYVQGIKLKLKQRYFELREEVRQELLKFDEQPYIELAGKVHDIEEESVANLLTDLQLADIDRHIEEIRAIDAALLRISDHSYGICAECGNDIEKDRLSAFPTAKRCHVCQTQHEKTFAQTAWS